jgi:hypothetical protein
MLGLARPATFNTEKGEKTMGPEMPETLYLLHREKGNRTARITVSEYTTKVGPVQSIEKVVILEPDVPGRRVNGIVTFTSKHKAKAFQQSTPRLHDYDIVSQKLSALYAEGWRHLIVNPSPATGTAFVWIGQRKKSRKEATAPKLVHQSASR